jgi:hypothetical protein
MQAARNIFLRLFIPYLGIIAFDMPKKNQKRQKKGFCLMKKIMRFAIPGFLNDLNGWSDEQERKNLGLPACLLK